MWFTYLGIARVLAASNGLPAFRVIDGVALVAGIWMLAMGTIVGRGLVLLSGSRLVANADGVWLGVSGWHPWSQIARFEPDTHPKGRDAFGAMILRDGRRIALHALREEEFNYDERSHAHEVSQRLRTLNRLLDEARHAS